MADLTLVGKNNQKKTYSVFASEVITSANIGDTLFTLPPKSLVTGITAVESDGSGAGETVLGGIAVGSYYPTGATVTVASGTTDSEIVVVEYVEIALTNGQYTN